MTMRRYVRELVAVELVLAVAVVVFVVFVSVEGSPNE